MAIGVRISGDFRRLGNFVGMLDRVTKGNLLDRVAKALASDLNRQVHRAFAASMSPEGVSWKPVKRGGRPLIDTGRLQVSFRITYTKKAVVMTTRRKGAATQNFGATIRREGRRGMITFVVDPRPFLPSGLPDDPSTQALREAAAGAFLAEVSRGLE